MSLLHCCRPFDFCSIGERNVLVVLSEGQRLALESADTVIIWLLSSWYQSKTLFAGDSSAISWLVRPPALMQQEDGALLS